MSFACPSKIRMMILSLAALLRFGFRASIRLILTSFLKTALIRMSHSLISSDLTMYFLTIRCRG